MNAGSFGSRLPATGVRYSNSPCEICSAQATGVHYGVVACEGCKAFYRRTFISNTVYECAAGTQPCNIKLQSKGRCRACRYRKCVEMGMKLDATTKGRTPLRKRCVYRAVADITPQTSPVPKKAIKGSSAELARAPAFQQSSLPLVDSPNQTVDLNPPSVRELVVEEILATEDFFSEAVSLRSPLQFPATTPFLLSSLTTSKYSKVDIDGPYSSSSYGPNGPGDVMLQSLMNSTGNIYDTMSAVSSAVQSVYAADFAVWDADMHDMLVNGNIPHQPQLTPAAYKEQASAEVLKSVRMNCDLWMRMPGFSSLEEPDQQMMLKERWSEGWLISHFRQIQGHNFYHLNGPLRVHGSIYWNQQFLDADLLRAFFQYGVMLNKLKLSHIEAFLLYAISMFTPEANSVQNTTKLALLQSHYRDCLLHVIRSNASPPSGSKDAEGVEKRVRDILKTATRLRYFNALCGHGYVNKLEYARDFEED